MNYALAKQLKDAGFPKEHILGEFSCSKGCVEPSALFSYCFAAPPDPPTLEELIAACEVVWLRLEKRTEGVGTSYQYEAWTAYARKEYPKKCDACCANSEHFIGQSFLTDGLANTPEEAVANLWLALNKKS